MESFFLYRLFPSKSLVASSQIHSVFFYLCKKRKEKDKKREEEEGLRNNQSPRKVNEGDKEALTSLKDQKNVLTQIENMEFKETKFFLREKWAAKADWPTKKIFQMRKVKQVADYITLLKNQQGIEASSEKENKVYIHNQYMKLFWKKNQQEASQMDSLVVWDQQ